MFETGSKKDLSLIIPNESIYQVYNNLGKKLVLLHQKRIKDQTNIDGTTYPALKESTIKQKEREGSHFAKDRMRRSDDFRRHAFEYYIVENGLIFTISDKMHKYQKLYNARQAWETREANSKAGKKPTNRKSKPRSEKSISHEDIALYNLSGDFEKYRSAYNPGANFFGLNQAERTDAIKYVCNSFATIAKQNISNDIGKTITNARLR